MLLLLKIQHDYLEEVDFNKLLFYYIYGPEFQYFHALHQLASRREVIGRKLG